MAAQPGIEALIKIGTTPSSSLAADTYTTLGGIRTTSFTRNRESIDVTTVDSANAMTVLPQGGVKSTTISGAGLFSDAGTSHATLETAYKADVLYNYEIVIPEHGTYRGKFEIQSLEFGADYNGALTFSVTLNSSGVVEFTAAP